MNGKREHQTAADARKPHNRCRKCAHFTAGGLHTAPKCACKDHTQCPLATVRAVSLQFYESRRHMARKGRLAQLAAACIGMAAVDMTTGKTDRSVQEPDKVAARAFLADLGPWGRVLCECAGEDPDYVQDRGRAFLAAVNAMEARKPKEVEVLK